MSNQSNPPPAPDPKPNTTVGPIPRKKSNREKLASAYPSFMRQTKNPLSTDTNILTPRGVILAKLGVTEADLAKVPKIRDRVKAGWGSIEEAISILSEDDNSDSIRFMEKWNSLTEREHQNVFMEDVLIAAGLDGRRFIELLAGATIDHDDFVFKLSKSRRKMRVLDSAFKAATDEVPILDAEGEVVGASNGDVKAMELFFKLTGDIKPNNVLVDNRRQTATINTPAPERPPLQSMDSWLLEIDDIRKPKQLNAPVEPVIPVEIPENAPEIEFLDVD